MGKIKWLLRRWLENWLYHAAHKLTVLSWRLSQKPPDIEARIRKLKSNWKGVITSAPAETRKTTAIAILMSAGIEPEAVEDDTLILSARYAHHKAIMEQPENQRIADQIISNFFGQPMHVSWSQTL